MKLNLQLMKLVIRLLILMIIFVMLFILSLTLYSARYWSDVYNYIHANITIKRIPTITDLNYVVIGVRPTEVYTEYKTTDNYDGETTIDFDIDDELTLDDIDFEKKKRSIENDYSEVPTKTIRVEYFFDLGETNLIKDFIDGELTTRTDDVEILPSNFELKGRLMERSSIEEEFSYFVFPWIAAIFVKNSSSDQFNYYCDGALLSHTSVITAASCVQSNNLTMKPDDFIVLFGKTSRKTVKDNEIVAKVKDIKIHQNFSERNQGNDLAILITEEPVIFTDKIQAATLGSDVHEDQLITSGWAITGELTAIALKSKEKVACSEEAKTDDTVCAVYGNDITVCPSYGGLYVTKQDTWYLQGVRTGDPEDRGVCFNKNVAFTSLNSHWNWIKNNIE